MTRLTTFALVFVLTVVVAVSGRAPAPISAQAPPLDAGELSLAQAQLVLAAAIAAAEEQGTRMDIAVVDNGGHLQAFARMDGAWLGSIDIALAKARTARYFDVPTEELGKPSQPGEPLYGIEASNGGLVTFPGGLPRVAADGTVIGAVGVSGATVEDDRAVAEAGVATLAAFPAVFAQPSGGGGAAGGVTHD